MNNIPFVQINYILSQKQLTWKGVVCKQNIVVISSVFLLYIIWYKLERYKLAQMQKAIKIEMLANNKIVNRGRLNHSLESHLIDYI